MAISTTRSGIRRGDATRCIRGRPPRVRAPRCAPVLRHAFALGVNNNDRGLRKVVEAAGLDWSEGKLIALIHSGLFEENRQAMYASGLWGVPSFRLLDPEGEPLLATWGQDRLWLVAQTLRKALEATSH